MANVEVLRKIGTPTVSDALEALGLSGATTGITPVWDFGTRIVGRAVTVQLTAAGVTPARKHLGVTAINLAEKNTVLVIDNGGRTDTSSFGGVLATAASLSGLEGVVIDGACRDIDDYVELGFPVFAKGRVVATARGRVMELATNTLIQFNGVQVRPDDVVVGDRSGVVIIPQEHLDRVIDKAVSLEKREQEMILDLQNGLGIAEVDSKYGYERMLEGQAGGPVSLAREGEK